MRLTESDNLFIHLIPATPTTGCGDFPHDPSGTRLQGPSDVKSPCIQSGRQRQQTRTMPPFPAPCRTTRQVPEISCVTVMPLISLSYRSHE